MGKSRLKTCDRDWKVLGVVGLASHACSTGSQNHGGRDLTSIHLVVGSLLDTSLPLPWLVEERNTLGPKVLPGRKLQPFTKNYTLKILQLVITVVVLVVVVHS